MIVLYSAIVATLANKGSGQLKNCNLKLSSTKNKQVFQNS